MRPRDGLPLSVGRFLLVLGEVPTNSSRLFLWLPSCRGVTLEHVQSPCCAEGPRGRMRRGGPGGAQGARAERGAAPSRRFQPEESGPFVSI